jgi:glycosyltransferase involved in cell wall biosynthesis
MACRCPVVASRVGGFKEVIDEESLKKIFAERRISFTCRTWSLNATKSWMKNTRHGTM